MKQNVVLFWAATEMKTVNKIHIMFTMIYSEHVAKHRELVPRGKKRAK
jgi:hypothetical protein